jgi:hypothetical protein
LESDLRKFIKNQPPYYLFKNISENVAINFDRDNINELIAEVGVLNEHILDGILNEKVKEMLYYGYGRKTE